jgi:hypothetical protein
MSEMLHDELVPLSMASLAYFDLNRVKGEADSDEHLRDVGCITACITAEIRSLI